MRHCRWHICCHPFAGGSTWKNSATMSQSAECGAAFIPEWYASLAKHDTVCVVAARMHIYLWLVTQRRRATGWNFLCHKTIHGKCYLQIILLIFTNYNLKYFKNVECLNTSMNGSKPIDSHRSCGNLFGAHLPPPTCHPQSIFYIFIIFRMLH